MVGVIQLTRKQKLALSRPVTVCVWAATFQSYPIWGRVQVRLLSHQVNYHNIIRKQRAPFTRHRPNQLGDWLCPPADQGDQQAMAPKRPTKRFVLQNKQILGQIG